MDWYDSKRYHYQSRHEWKVWSNSCLSCITKEQLDVPNSIDIDRHACKYPLDEELVVNSELDQLWPLETHKEENDPSYE